MTSFLESQVAQCGKYLLGQIMVSFFESQITSWFGSEFCLTQIAQCGPRNNSEAKSCLIFKVKSRLGLERECMYASRTGGNNGYGAPVEKELVKTHFGQKYSLTSKNVFPPQICDTNRFIWV
jgi:hypothetical protein